MEMFNKIYSQVSSSVSSTVSQLSGVLPGNPVTREFEASHHIASAGPGLLWKIYKGTKRSTKQEASIFVFEKRQLEKYSKNDRDFIIDTLKRGVTQLTKIRHPQILTVQHPLEESRESLAFATEPVFASLANVLGKTKNTPQPGNLTDYKLFDVEVKYGLLQVGQGLTFLHTDMKLLHRNLCPETIVINQSGVWKIFGFDFCVHNTSPANCEASYPFQAYERSLPAEGQPSLDYQAPECIVTSEAATTASDIYALGMVTYVVHSVGNRPLGGAVKDVQQFKQRVHQLKVGLGDKLQCVPEGLRDVVLQMLHHSPTARPDPHTLTRCSHFSSLPVLTLLSLDSLLQWDNLQRSQFYKGLPDALTKLPHRVRVQRVLPCLQRDLSQAAMVPFVLPSVLDIAEGCEDQGEFVREVLPGLKQVMKLVEPIQILLILLHRMPLLLRLTPPADVQQHVLPMLYRGLDSSSPQIHELCLSVLPTFAGLLDHANVKNSLLPRIKKLCLATSSLSVRVNCLLCVGKLLECLDKWLVLDEVLPFLPQIPSREPAVLMGILGVYKIALEHKKLGISKEIIATRILPFLMPLCIENGLTLQQFNALVSLIKAMLSQVETEHRTKLEQLNSVQEENKVLAAALPSLTTSKSTSNATMDGTSFAGLGLDDYGTKTSNSSPNVKDLGSLLDTTPPVSPPKVVSPPGGVGSNHLASLNLSSKVTSLSNSNNTPVKPFAAVNNPSFMTAAVNSPSFMTAPINGPSFLTAVPSSRVPVSSQAPFMSPSPFTPPNNNWQQPMNLNMNQMSQMTYGNNNNNGNNNWSSPNQFNRPTTNRNDTNWSALDNLLPKSGVNNAKTPLNQMLTPTSQPLLMGTTSNSSTTNSALSKDDIMDLLN